MNEQQVVTAPRQRKRRRIGIYLLAAAPVAAAAALGIVATSIIPAPAATPVAQSADLGVGAGEAPQDVPADVTAAVLADKGATFAAAAQTVKVTPIVEEEPEPVVQAPIVSAKAPASSGSTSSGSTSKSSTSKSSTSKSTTTKSSTTESTKEEPKEEPKPKTPSYKEYCAAPASPYSAASSDIKALLSAANKERARIGAGKLSWSGGLADAAQKWSKAMASKDDSTDAPHDALAHNPNRPGAENVAVSYSSGGMSKSRALGKAHTNWMYSNGHCLNIMNPSYSSMGAGTAQTSDGTTWYTTENFR